MNPIIFKNNIRKTIKKTHILFSGHPIIFIRPYYFGQTLLFFSDTLLFFKIDPIIFWTLLFLKIISVRQLRRPIYFLVDTLLFLSDPIILVRPYYFFSDTLLFFKNTLLFLVDPIIFSEHPIILK